MTDKASPGDWRTRTEDRPAPPPLGPGARLSFAPDLSAMVVEVSAVSARLVVLRFEQPGDAFWSALYRYGRPVQYAYTAGPLELWHTQSAWAARPWSVEAPSAGRPLSPTLLGDVARRGVKVAALTHAAGLSSTGEPALDRALPLPERYDYAGVLPDKIAVYRLPLEEEFGDDPQLLVEEIRVTVLHELAHHFGIDEDRLEELGWS